MRQQLCHTANLWLGNGLLDYLDRASGRMEANFFRLRGCSCAGASSCESACDSFHGSSDYAPMTSDMFESHSSMSHPHSHSGGHSNGHQEGSSVPSSETLLPVPIPDPIASPPNPTPMRQGNPFLDEARFTPKDDFVPPIKTGLPKPTNHVRHDFDFAKVDVKPVPKHLLRPRALEKVIDQLENVANSQVIPAGLAQPSTASQVQFAR